MKKEQLIKAMGHVQVAVCAYKSRTFCDCKFGIDTDKVHHSSEQTGCPEVRTVLGILATMTDKEYERILKRQYKAKQKAIKEYKKKHPSLIEEKFGKKK